MICLGIIKLTQSYPILNLHFKGNYQYTESLNTGKIANDRGAILKYIDLKVMFEHNLEGNTYNILGFSYALPFRKGLSNQKSEQLQS